MIQVNACTLLQSGCWSWWRQFNLNVEHGLLQRRLCCRLSSWSPHAMSHSWPQFKMKSQRKSHTVIVVEHAAVLSCPHGNFLTTDTRHLSVKTVGHFVDVKWPQSNVVSTVSVHWHGAHISSQRFWQGWPSEHKRRQLCRHFLASVWFRSSMWHLSAHVWPHWGKNSAQILLQKCWVFCCCCSCECVIWSDGERSRRDVWWRGQTSSRKVPIELLHSNTFRIDNLEQKLHKIKRTLKCSGYLNTKFFEVGTLEWIRRTE